MTKEYYDNKCKNVIQEYVVQLLNIEHDLNISSIKFNEKKLNKIYVNYEKKRKEIRRYFMNIETKPMDRHKIGAVVLYAILKSHVFNIKLTKQHLPDILLMANEYLAVYMALTVVESYRIDEFKIPQNKLNDDNRWRLIMPKVLQKNSPDTYIDNLCKALYYVKNPERLDIFAYANILYNLEVYTNEIIGYDPLKC